MNAILADPHIDTRIKICILMNVMYQSWNMQVNYGKGTRSS